MSTTDATPTPSLESGTWILDPADSAVEFVSRTLWGAVRVHGSFSEYEGRLDLSATPAISLVIRAARPFTTTEKISTVIT